MTSLICTCQRRSSDEEAKSARTNGRISESLKLIQEHIPHNCQTINTNFHRLKPDRSLQLWVWISYWELKKVYTGFKLFAISLSPVRFQRPAFVKQYNSCHEFPLTWRWNLIEMTLDRRKGGMFACCEPFYTHTQ